MQHFWAWVTNKLLNNLKQWSSNKNQQFESVNHKFTVKEPRATPVVNRNSILKNWDLSIEG